MEPEINKDIAIETLLEIKPRAVSYLMDKGIRCLICGEPMWGTLQEAAKEKGFTARDIEKFVDDINMIE
jgi:hypothetical protein